MQGDISFLPKKKATFKDLLNSDQLEKGGVLLEKQLAEQKIMFEAVDFEKRNRRANGERPK